MCPSYSLINSVCVIDFTSLISMLHSPSSSILESSSPLKNKTYFICLETQLCSTGYMFVHVSLTILHHLHWAHLCSEMKPVTALTGAVTEPWDSDPCFCIMRKHTWHHLFKHRHSPSATFKISRASVPAFSASVTNQRRPQ